jgi:hypothetical protein
MVGCCVPRSCPVSQSRRVSVALLFLILVVSFLPVRCQRLSSAEAPPPVRISAAVATAIAAVCRGVRPNLLRDPSHQ